MSASAINRKDGSRGRRPTSTRSSASHMLADGYDIVMDLEKSKGSWVYDAKRIARCSTSSTNFASCPIGYNHPRIDNPEFRERLVDASAEQAGQLRHLHDATWPSSSRPSPARSPRVVPQAHVLRRGRRARHRERAEDGLRLEGPQELQEGRQGREGHADHASAASASTAAPATRCR